ncbi:hypothetical protein QQ045_003388 [Rhodiola kirilowii]
MPTIAPMESFFGRQNLIGIAIDAFLGTCRLLHKRAGFQPEVRVFPVIDGLMEKLRMMDAGRERIRLDGLIRPSPSPVVVDEIRDPVEGLSVEDARKLLRLAQLESVKMKLGGIKESWMTYEKFVDICSEDCGKEGLGVAKILDQSGAVIVLGDMVFLHPQQEKMGCGNQLRSLCLHTDTNLGHLEFS